MAQEAHHGRWGSSLPDAHMKEPGSESAGEPESVGRDLVRASFWKEPAT